jgi:hypothetical protein
MKKVLNPNFEAGSGDSNEPRLLGSILSEMLHGSSPLAIGYRQYIASRENETNEDEKECETNRLFEDIYPHTELDIDLKLFTLKPGRIGENEFLPGMLTRDGENHYSFVQNASKKKRVVNTRNPQVYKGTCINVNEQNDGTLYLSFNRPHYTEEFTFKHFCLKAAEELLVVAGLVEEE